MADAPAAAAAASPPATPAPTPTPSGKAPAPFDARLQLAKSLHPARVTMPEASTPGGATDGAAEGDGDGATEEAEPPTEGSAGDGAGGGEASAEGDGAAEEEGDGAGDAPARSEKERLDAVIKAFAAGDIEAMAKALEQPGVKISGPVRRQFRAFQRRVQKLDAREQELKDKDRTFEDAKAKAQQAIADDSRRLSQAERELTRKFGTAYQLETAWEQEDMVAVGKALERACKGASLAEITQKLATGKTGKTPEERALAERERKLQEAQTAEQRKAQQAEEAKKTAQQREAAIGRIGEGLKTHPYLQMKDPKSGEMVLDTEALNEVFSAYEASWNGEKFTKTARKCADELQEKLVARATARGLAPVTAPPPPAGKAGKPQPGKKPPQQRTGVKEPPRTQPSAAARLDLDSTRANRVALAKRQVEMQRRGVLP